MTRLSMDSAFTLVQQDIFCISLSLNALYFLQVVTSQTVNWVLPFLGKRGSRWKTLLGLHQKWPHLLGRLLMEQLSLLILLILVLVDIGFVSSVVPPFRHQRETGVVDVDNNADTHQESNNNNNTYHQLTRTILSSSFARFFLIAVTILQNSNKEVMPIRITSTSTRNPFMDLVYCVFSMVSILIGMGYKQNLLLLVTSPFMEIDSTSLVICRLIKLADRHHCCRSYFKTSVLCCASFVFSRILLPVLFLGHALAQESPLVMGKVPLAWFFISGFFHIVFHTMLMFYSVRRIVKASALLPEGASRSHSVHEPFSVCNYSQRLMNNIYEDCDEIPDFCLDKEGFDSEDLQFKSKPTTKLRDLNYGFLAPYDNRNLCSFVTGVEEEKMNFLQKKNFSKNAVVYKFMIQGERSSDQECCCNRGNKDDCSGDDMEFCKDVEVDMAEIGLQDDPPPEDSDR